MGKYVGAALAVALIAEVAFGLGAIDFFFPPQAQYTRLSSSSNPQGVPAAGPLMPPAEQMFPFRWPLGDEPIAIAEARP